MIHRQYLQLSERDISEISPTWRAIHVYSLITIVIFGFVTAYAFGVALEGFDNNCILYPNITFFDPNSTTSIPPEPENTNVITEPKWGTISHRKTDWGQIELCNFCQFAPIVSSIFSFVWIVFLCSDIFGLPWRSIYPSIVISTIYSIIFLVSSLKLEYGILAFCAEFEDQLNTTSCTKKIDRYTLSFHEVEKEVFIYLRISVFGSYIILAAWIVSLGTLVLRILFVADFQLWLVTLKEIEQEEVKQMVIDVEDEEEPDERVLKYDEYEDNDNEEEMVSCIIEPVEGLENDTQHQPSSRLRRYSRLLYY